MGYMAIYKRESYAEGIAQGIERGVDKGRAETLQKLLKLKFGDRAERWLAKLEQASNEQLELWAERILFADSVEAVFAE